MLLRLLPILPLVGCSNWAQLSGSNNQNTVWSQEATPWPRRWGFASTFIQQYVLPADASLDAPVLPGQSPSPSPQPRYSAPSALLIMGGEEWRADNSGRTIDPAPRARQGATLRGKRGGAVGGFGQNFDGDPILPNEAPADMRAPDVSGALALSNDVFVTRGKSWRKFTDHRQRTVAGEPQPKLVSNVTWEMKRPWEGIPRQYLNRPWKDYLGCCHAPVPGSAFAAFAALSKPFRCSLGLGEQRAGCLDEDGNPSDPYRETRRWSPRRGAAAVTLYEPGLRPPAIFVMGGRARSFEIKQLQELSNLQSSDSFKREMTWLMSDVWVSYDEGQTWDFRNVGCWALSENTATLPTANTCTSHTDCWGMNLGDTQCVKQHPSDRVGSCVCKGWSPREFFGAAVNMWKADTPYLYISGGFGAAQGQKCGRTACGEDYSVFYQDVWRSGAAGDAQIGTLWQRITPMGEAMVKGESGRAHTQLLFANYRMFFLTGMGALKGDAAKNALFSTMFVSEHGDLWEPYALSPAADPSTFTARFGALAATDVKSLFVFGGMQAAKEGDSALALSPPVAVAAAAKRAPTNLLQPPPPPPPPDEFFVVSGEPVLPSSEFFQLFLEPLAVLAAPFAAQLGVWYKDFENPQQPDIAKYLHPHWPLDEPLDVLNVSAGDAARLASKFGIATARQLAAITRDQVLQALDKNQADIPNICLYLRAAQAFCYFCSVKFRPFAGFDDWTLFDPTLGLYVPGAEPKPPPDPPDDGCTVDNWSTMSAPPAWATVENTMLGPFDPSLVAPMFRGTNYVCRSTPPPRRSGAMAVMDGTVYVAGGWLAPDFFANDLWYRDDVPPVTTITTMPAGTATTLNVECDEGIACLFEARFYDGVIQISGADEAVEFKGSLIRDWALISLPFDVIAINAPNKPTTVHLRAVDAAGNKDFSVRGTCCSQADVFNREKISSCRVLCPGVSLLLVKDPPPIRLGGVNVLTWTYTPPFPTGTLLIGIFSVIMLLGLIYWLRRRYLRKQKLAYFARRRLERARAAKQREKRKLKKVKKIIKVRVMKKHRPKADNPFSETAADLGGRFRELMRTRSSRSRPERIGLATDPLGAVPLTTINPPKPPDTRLSLATHARRRTAKEALEFDPLFLAQDQKKQTEQVAKAFMVEMDVARRDIAAREMGRREGLAADKMRSALAVHSDSIVAHSKQGVLLGKLPLGIAERAAKHYAAQQGRKGDAAWERSAIKNSLHEQMAEQSKAALKRAKAAMDQAKSERGGGGGDGGGGGGGGGGQKNS